MKDKPKLLGFFETNIIAVKKESLHEKYIKSLEQLEHPGLKAENFESTELLSDEELQCEFETNHVSIEPIIKVEEPNFEIACNEDSIQSENLRKRTSECTSCGKNVGSNNHQEVNESKHQGIIKGIIKLNCDECIQKFGLKNVQVTLIKTILINDPSKSVNESHHEYSSDKFSSQSRLKFCKASKDEILTCQECCKIFTQKSSLNVHIKAIHQGIKHACHKCNKKFTQNGHLTQHLKAVHKKVKDFSCNLCNRKFALKQQLNLHSRIIHNKIFTCDFCETKFGLKDQLVTSALYILM